MYTKEKLIDYLEWDEYAWSNALYAWDELLRSIETKNFQALELGGRNGGLSLYLAEKGITTICSDFGGPTTKAKILHEKYQVTNRIEYKDIDATKINYPDNTFDIVIFKSILGVVAANSKIQNLELASQEIYRILKPGGFLLFAENRKASFLHQIARRLFVPWGTNWHYLSQVEMEHFISPYIQSKIYQFGFFSAFAKFKPLKKAIYLLDYCINRLIPSHAKYISYGWAKK